MDVPSDSGAQPRAGWARAKTPFRAAMSSPGALHPLARRGHHENGSTEVLRPAAPVCIRGRPGEAARCVPRPSGCSAAAASAGSLPVFRTPAAVCCTRKCAPNRGRGGTARQAPILAVLRTRASRQCAAPNHGGPAMQRGPETAQIKETRDSR